eukprot:5693616-Amphidinium_carterae.2
MKIFMSCSACLPGLKFASPCHYKSLFVWEVKGYYVLCLDTHAATHHVESKLQSQLQRAKLGVALLGFSRPT